MVRLLVVVVFQIVIIQEGDGNMKELFEVRYEYLETGDYKRLNAYKDLDYALLVMRRLNAMYGSPEPYYVKKIVIE